MNKFVVRHRPVKLKRFYEYLVVSGRGFKNMAKEVDVTKDTESEFCDTSIEAGNKEMNSALAYLQEIDPSGYLHRVTTTKFADDAIKERKERIDRMTTAMNLLEYKEYHKVIHSTQLLTVIRFYSFSFSDENFNILSEN